MAMQKMMDVSMNLLMFDESLGNSHGNKQMFLQYMALLL